MPKLIYHDSDGIDKVLALGTDPIYIGRATECHVQTQDAMVSRRHARIIYDGNYWIEDMGSSNGVWVGNERVKRAPFRPGDTITCGSLILRLMPDTGQRMNAAAAHALQAETLPPPPLVSPPRAVRAPPAAAPPSAAAPPPAAEPPSESARDRQRIAELEVALAGAQLRAREAEALQRRVEQLSTNLRRMRGGQAGSDDDTADDRDRAARAAAEAERDRLRARVLELESQLSSARSGPTHNGEADRLQRRVEQLTAELRRARGPEMDDTRDEVDRSALVAAQNERDRSRQRIAELESKLAATASAAAAHAAAAVTPSAGPSSSAASAVLADAAIALGDTLAQLRTSLRAASDEAALLTQPSESVLVVGDALRSATEHMEAARAALRALGKLLGVA